MGLDYDMMGTRLCTSPPSKRKSHKLSNYISIIIHKHVQNKKLLRILNSLNVHYCTSLHSKLCKIVLWYQRTRIIWMDYL